jgi:hypothetical protein
MGIKTPSDGGGAPTDASYVTGDSDPTLSSEIVVSPASEILTSGDIGNSTAISPGFDTFTVASSTGPAFVAASGLAKTGGTANGRIKLAVDESGGSTADYAQTIAFAADAFGSAAFGVGQATALLPTGATFSIENTADPVDKNQIESVRATLISP